MLVEREIAVYLLAKTNKDMFAKGKTTLFWIIYLYLFNVKKLLGKPM